MLLYPDKLQSNNPQAYGIVDASQISGHKSVKQIIDLYSISDVILSGSGNNTNNDAIGQLIWVADIRSFYQLINWENRNDVDGWKSYSMQATVFTGDTPPGDTTFLWYNEDVASTPITINDALLMQVQKRMDDLELKSNFFEYAFTKKMDSGGLDFFAGSELKLTDGIKPGSDGDINFVNADEQEPDEEGSLGVVEIEPKDWSETLQPNITHFCVKRGKANEIGEYTIQDGEFVYIKDKNFLYIGNDGAWKLINSSSGGGGTDPDPDNPDPENPDDMSKPLEYIDLICENLPSRNFRIRVTQEGRLKVYDASIETAEDQKILQNNAECLKGLVISNIYAGPDGAKPTDFNVCSHSYVELYNSTTLDINLKGCSLQYGSIKQSWGVVPLKGIVEANSCFTIRCNQVSDITVNTTKTIIDDFDMDCPEVVLSNLGFKLYLGIGITDINVDNPWTTNGFLNGYIDCVGIKNVINEVAHDINGFETSAPNLLNDVRGVVRKNLADYNAKYPDSNSNTKDFLPIDFSTDIDIKNANEIYKPWSSKRGKKTLFYNRTKFSASEPNMPTIFIGNVPTTRNFNWIGVGYYDEFLWYKKSTDTTWTKVESLKDGDYKRRRIKGFDGVHFTVHKAIVENLSPGITYDWKCGKDGCMSQDSTFKTFGNDTNQTFKFVQVSDQQDFVFGGYEPWGICLDKIIKAENSGNRKSFPADNNGIHFMVNTGDMSQNGNRPAEWLDYYNACNRGDMVGKESLSNVPQMNVVGNNDLCPLIGELSGKVNPDSFEYYHCYGYDKTPAIFEKQKYQGDTMKSVYAFDYGCAHFVMANSNNYIEEQKAWFIAHMEEVKKRTFQPKWLIFVTHDAVFNITTDTTETAKVGSGKRDSKLNQSTDPDPQKRFAWSRLLEQYGFRLGLSGHKHTYSRSYPLKETLQTPSDSNQNLPVNYLRPTFSTDTGLGDGVTYIMCQASGYKLQSNKDVPAQGIGWLAKYYAGANNVSSANQKAPTFIVYTVSTTQLIMKSYQVLNVTDGGSWNCFNGGQPGVTDYDNMTVSKIDEIVITYK